MRKRIVLAAAGCVVIGSVLLSACSSTVTASVPDVIRVQNVDADEGKISLNTSETVKVTPDMAMIVFGITTEHEEAARCQQDNTESLNRLLEYLKAQGIEESSIKTSGFSLDPRYDWSSNRQVLVGYEMRTQVTVTDVPMDQVGSMLSQGVENGANEISSVSYFASNYDEAYGEALTKAVELAKVKAGTLAAASGRKLGQVLNIEEYGDNQYGRYVSADYRSSNKLAMEAVSGAGMAEDMGVMPGEMEVTASISIEFALAPEE